MTSNPRKVLIGSILLVVTFVSVSYTLVTPKYKNIFDAEISLFTYDIVNGEKVFYASGCNSCHLDSDKSKPPLLLAGGLPLTTNFGTFYGETDQDVKVRGKCNVQRAKWYQK